MPSLSPEMACIQRRNFCQGLTWGLTSAMFLTELEALFGQSGQQAGAPTAKCQAGDIKFHEAVISLPAERLHYWLDGLMGEGRANLACLLKIEQKPTSFVNKVVLATAEKQTLGVRYFTPGDKLAQGFAPYLIFNEVDFNVSAHYFIIVQVQEESQNKVYRFTLDRSRLVRSLLWGEHLPAEVEEDFRASHKGRVSSQLYFPLKLIDSQDCAVSPASPSKCLGAYLPEVQVMEISENGAFQIAVRFKRGELNAQSYFRYFIVTDPLGRLLGLTKQQWQENSSGQAVIVALNDQQRRERWGIGKEHVAVITDCPYVKVFAEDVREGLFQWDVWLR